MVCAHTSVREGEGGCHGNTELSGSRRAARPLWLLVDPEVLADGRGANPGAAQGLSAFPQVRPAGQLTVEDGHYLCPHTTQAVPLAPGCPPLCPWHAVHAGVSAEGPLWKLLPHRAAALAHRRCTCSWEGRCDIQGGGGLWGNCPKEAGGGAGWMSAGLKVQQLFRKERKKDRGLARADLVWDAFWLQSGSGFNFEP